MRQIQVIAIYRLLSGFTDAFDLYTFRVCQCQYFSRFSLQKFIIFYLKSHDPLIVTSGKSEHLGSECPMRIIPLIILIDLYTGQPHLTDLIAGLYIYI